MSDHVKERGKNRKTSCEKECDRTQDDSDAPSSVDVINRHLEDTKGVRQIAVWEHFSDLKRFINSAKPLTRKFGAVLAVEST